VVFDFAWRAAGVDRPCLAHLSLPDFHIATVLVGALSVIANERRARFRALPKAQRPNNDKGGLCVRE
jgi:hypothetical protein